MTRDRTVFVSAVVGVAAILALGFWLARPRPAQPRPARAPTSSVALTAPPALLPSRVGTPEHPLQSWERLLAADGSPREDLAALADLTTNYLQAVPSSRRPALGFNEELAHALTERENLGESALPKTHPALVGGRLVDRWGTPWLLHPLSADVLQLRSAGPDRRLYTADDLVAPPPATETAP